MPDTTAGINKGSTTNPALMLGEASSKMVRRFLTHHCWLDIDIVAVSHSRQ